MREQKMRDLFITINKPTSSFFYRPDALPVTQPTVSSTEGKSIHYSVSKIKLAHVIFKTSFENSQKLSEMLIAEEDCSVEWLTSLCNLTVAQGKILHDWRSNILLQFSKGKEIQWNVDLTER